MNDRSYSSFHPYELCSCFGGYQFSCIHNITDELTVIQLDYPVRNTVVPVIMRYDQHGFTIALQFGEELKVEHGFELRVLIGRPLVKDVDWTVLEISGEQGKSFSLPLGKFRGGELSVHNLDFVG